VFRRQTKTQTYISEYGYINIKNDKMEEKRIMDIKNKVRLVQEKEIELLKQLFVYYDFKTNLLYLSDIRFKKHFEHIIHKITGNNYILKGMYKGKDTFLDIIKTVEEIKFSTQNNLFSTDSKKKTALVDLTGVTDDIDLTLDIKANSHRFRHIKLIKELMEEEDRYALSGLLIRGKDEKGFECIYNQENFIMKIDISAEKNSGKFDAYQRTYVIEISEENIDIKFSIILLLFVFMPFVIAHFDGGINTRLDNYILRFLLFFPFIYCNRCFLY